MTDSRQRILDAAEDLFAERGLNATAVTDIADRVGVSGPALYKHYPNKRAIFEAVLQRLFGPFDTMVEQLTDAQWDAAVASILAHHIDHPNISRIIQHATLAGGEILEILTEQWYVPFFSRVRETLGERGEVDQVALMALHSAMLGYITLAPLHRAIFNTEPLTPSATEALRQVLASMSMVWEEHHQGGDASPVPPRE